MSSIHINAQKLNDTSEKKQVFKFDKDLVYIVCRGTKSKQSLISENFNLFDKNITHVAIGIFRENKFSIYNVSNDIGNKKNSFVIENIESFINRKDIQYWCLWGFKPPKQVRKMIFKNCEAYRNRFINFDNSFQLNNRDSLYCSEFVALIFNESGVKPLIKPTLKIFKDYFLQQMSGKKQILYFPVDFFLMYKNVKKIYEYRVNL